MNKIIQRPLLAVIALVIVVATIIYLEFDDNQIIQQTSGNLDVPSTESPQEGNNQAPLKEKSEKNKMVFLVNKAPEFTGISNWLNSEPLTMESLRGKVVLIDFWTYSCINCIRTLPHIVEWDSKYRDKGLVIIGVHTPEFEFEKVPENVQAAMDTHGIKYPVAQDNNYATWNAWKNRYWPHKFLVDKDGKIRYDHIGEGGYEETEKKIQELLAELGEDVDVAISEIPDMTPKSQNTPELYAGYDFALPRGQNVGNGGLIPGKIIEYKKSEDMDADIVYLEGKWKSNPDNLEAMDEYESKILLDFTAGSVNIVADALEDAVMMEVLIDDKPITEKQAGNDVTFKDGKGIVVIDAPRLYNVYKGSYGGHLLTLQGIQTGFTFHAFTFG